MHRHLQRLTAAHGPSNESTALKVLPFPLAAQLLSDGFTEEEWSEHQRITYVALMVLGIDGMNRLGEVLLRPRRAMTYNEMMNSGIQQFS